MKRGGEKERERKGAYGRGWCALDALDQGVDLGFVQLRFGGGFQYSCSRFWQSRRRTLAAARQICTFVYDVRCRGCVARSSRVLLKRPVILILISRLLFVVFPKPSARMMLRHINYTGPRCTWKYWFGVRSAAVHRHIRPNFFLVRRQVGASFLAHAAAVGLSRGSSQ